MKKVHPATDEVLPRSASRIYTKVHLNKTAENKTARSSEKQAEKKNCIAFVGTTVRFKFDLSREMMEAKTRCNSIFKMVKENNCSLC